jgi:hypothetical protein
MPDCILYLSEPAKIFRLNLVRQGQLHGLRLFEGPKELDLFQIFVKNILYVNCYVVLSALSVQEYAYLTSPKVIFALEPEES